MKSGMLRSSGILRSSGVLMPISSLPSSHGIGTLGKEAYNFVDFLKKSAQSYWQILPIGPTGFGDSPYQSFSAFAGNPYWIDLELLAAEGLLSGGEIENAGFFNRPRKIDYGDLYAKRFKLLRKAVSRMSADKSFALFCEEHAAWLPDYACFMALKVKFGMGSFQEWPDGFRKRRREEIEAEKESLSDEIYFWSAIQYLFYQQWFKIKGYANEHHVKLIGDIPIYVSPDSSDLWASPELFQVDANLRMSNVAGCPPDDFSKTGQRWGNPLYDWKYHKKTDYSWWAARLDHAGKMFDCVRIDHFRGFSEYYSIPAKEETAISGTWKAGPGYDLISTIMNKHPGLEIIAEDLGHLTENVKKLLRESGFPGMKVLQFAFDDSEGSYYLPHKYNRNSVVYTGTHDNPTTADWALSAPWNEVRFARSYLGITEKESITQGFITAALSSVCYLAIIPIQDWLELGKDARINTPSTPTGNWTFRIEKGVLTDQLCTRIRALTELYGRD